MTEKTTWQRLIADLMAAKVTQVQLGERLGISQGHISDLRCGRILSPSYELGAALLSLHSEVMGKKDSMLSPSD
jgi:transcriptional regulator with XRE-family HTH domain